MVPRACPCGGGGGGAIDRGTRCSAPRPVQHGVGSQSLEGAAAVGYARQKPGITAPARCCLALQCPQRPQFIPAPANSSPSSRKTYICHDLPRIKTFRSNNYLRTRWDRSTAEKQTTFCVLHFLRLATHAAAHPGLSSMGWGRKALKAQPPSATRGRSPGSPRQHGVASRFNVRSARNSFRRPQIHPRAVGKLTSVTICRELKHSDQTITSEHGGTDRRRKNRLLFASCTRRRTTTRPVQRGGGVAKP